MKGETKKRRALKSKILADER